MYFAKELIVLRGEWEKEAKCGRHNRCVVDRKWHVMKHMTGVVGKDPFAGYTKTCLSVAQTHTHTHTHTHIYAHMHTHAIYRVVYKHTSQRLAKCNSYYPFIPNLLVFSVKNTQRLVNYLLISITLTSDIQILYFYGFAYNDSLVASLVTARIMGESQKWRLDYIVTNQKCEEFF